MTNTVKFRPKLSPPHGRRLERSYRPFITCLTVSGCITVLVCVVFGLTAFNIYSHRFGHTEHHYHVGDEMSLREASQDLSNVFCSAYAVHPMGWTDFYLIPQPARIESGESIPISFTLTALPVPYVEAIHYLPVNSTVTLSACYKNSTSDPFGPGDSERLAVFLVIVGDDNFREWDKHLNYRHVRYHIPIPHNATCDLHPSSLPTLSLTVPVSDNYHFILRRHRAPEPSQEAGHHATTTTQTSPASGHETDTTTTTSTTLILTGNITRTQFNLSATQAVCNYSETVCHFPLQWGGNQDVVARIPRDSENPDAPVTFATRCDERLELWIPVFGGVPVVMMALIWVWCWWLLVKKRELSARYRLRRQSSQVSRSRDYGSFGEERDPLIAEVPPTPPPEVEPIPEHETERCASIQG